METNTNKYTNNIPKIDCYRFMITMIVIVIYILWPNLYIWSYGVYVDPGIFIFLSKIAINVLWSETEDIFY